MCTVELNISWPYMPYALLCTHKFVYFVKWISLSLCSRFTTGPRPLDFFLNTYPVRLMFGLVFIVIVWWTPQVGEGGNFPLYYYGIVITLFMLHQVSWDTKCWNIATITTNIKAHLVF